MLQLKVGGVYWNRRGERVEILQYYGDDSYLYEDGEGRFYTAYGAWHVEGDDRDLIAEWIDEPSIPTPDTNLIIDDLHMQLASASTKGYDLMCKVAKLEASLAAAEAELASSKLRIEELLPKPAVKSVWFALFLNGSSYNYCYRPTYYFSPGTCIVRHDSITAPDGSVSYRVVIEPNDSPSMEVEK